MKIIINGVEVENPKQAKSGGKSVVTGTITAKAFLHPRKGDQLFADDKPIGIVDSYKLNNGEIEIATVPTA